MDKVPALVGSQPEGRAPAVRCWYAWAGIVYVLAWLIGLFLAPSAPDAFGSAGTINAYFSAHRAAAMIQSVFIHGLAGVALVAFAIALWNYLPGRPADDRGLQPAENITPLVRRDVIVRYGPSLAALINRISALLDTVTLRALDTRVELAGQDPRLVAGSWLRAHGLITAEGAVR